MAKLVFVLGNPGTGKTSSLRTLDKSQVGYMTASGKELPFKSNIDVVTVDSFELASRAVAQSSKPIIVIDDVNYLFTRRVFAGFRPDEKISFDMYRNMSNEFFALINTIVSKPSDQIVYLFGHLENPGSSLVELKTLGQSVRVNNTPEGWTNIVVECVFSKIEGHLFKVKADGSGIKTPFDMFKGDTIPADIKLLDSQIRKYYNMKSIDKKGD